MNKPGQWLTIARTSDHERSEVWRAAFGINVAPIKSVVAQFANIPGRPHSLCYFLDLDALTPEQKENVIRGIAEKYKISEIVVSLLIETEGVPIDAENVTVESTDQEQIFSLILGDEIPGSDPFYEEELAEWVDPDDWEIGEDPIEVKFCPDCKLPRDICSCVDPKPWNREDLND